MILALIGALAAAAPAEPDSFRRFALLVGANSGGRDRATLRYAVDDARAVGAVLGQLGGVTPGDQVILSNPSRASLVAALGDLRGRVASAESAGARTELVVYYSGHSDEEGLLLGAERFGYEELRRAVSVAPADVRVVILDSCASGAMVREKGGTKRPAFAVDLSVDVTGSAYLTSSSSTEVAQESDTLGGSFFTHFLVSGLRGAADVSEDGRVTLTEAYQYAYDETLRRTERTIAGAQHPEWDMELAGTGDLVLTDLRNTTAGLEADHAIQGRIIVRDADGRLVTELMKPADRRLELGLVPGNYRVLIDEDGRLREATFTVEEAGIVHLSSLTFTEVEGEPARARGATQYVDVPFTFAIIPSGGGEETRQHVALSLGWNQAARLDGVQIAVLGNVTRDGAAGAQIGSAFNVNGGDTRGLMASAAVNGVRGEFLGVQSASVLNVGTGDVRGLQASGAANLAGGRVEGAQLAGALNTAEGGRGLQGSGGLNVASEELVGVQVTGGLNVGERVVGAQVAPVNVAREVKGLQLAVVNVGGKVEGAQVGVINVADDVDGVSIGVLSFSRTGYNHGLVWLDAAGRANVGASFGGKTLFSTAHVGAPVVDPLGGWSAQLGLGVHVPVRSLYVDVGASAGNVGIARGPTGLLTSARAVVGVPLGEHVAAFAGPTVDLIVIREDLTLQGPSWLPSGVIPTAGGGMPWRAGLAAGVRF